MAVQYRQQMHKLKMVGVTAVCSAEISGGWERPNGDKGYYGVCLDIPDRPPAPKKRKGQNIRTGCLGLLGLIGACALLSRLPKPPTATTQVQRQAPAVPLVVVNTPEPTFTLASVVVVTEASLSTTPATEMPAPLPTVTPEPTDTVAPAEIPTEAPTVMPTDTEVPTDVPTEPPVATDTPVATEAPAQAATACLQIKGNVNSKREKIYHLPGDRDYERTKIKPEEGDQMFCSVAEAEAAGFRAPFNR